MCFGCGKRGYKVADCKEKKDAQVKVGRLICPNEFRPMKFVGKIGKYQAQMLLDSGADSSVVPPRLVEESEYLGKYVEATGLGGSLREKYGFQWRITKYQWWPWLWSTCCGAKD